MPCMVGGHGPDGLERLCMLVWHTAACDLPFGHHRRCQRGSFLCKHMPLSMQYSTDAAVGKLQGMSLLRSHAPLRRIIPMCP